MSIGMWVLQTTSLENSIWSASPIHIRTRLTDGLGVFSALCGQDWNSSSSISSPIVPDDISGPGVTISSPAASAATLSSTSEPPNSAVTTSCILWLAALKLPMETVGKCWEALLLGCALTLCRPRWKRQMMIVERLHIFSTRLPDVTQTHLFWKGARTVTRLG